MGLGFGVSLHENCSPARVWRHSAAAGSETCVECVVIHVDPCKKQCTLPPDMHDQRCEMDILETTKSVRRAHIRCHLSPFRQ